MSTVEIVSGDKAESSVFDKWLANWSHQVEILVAQAHQEAEQVSAFGVQGMLGRNTTGGWRTPSQAIALIALRMVEAEKKFSAAKGQLAIILSDLRRLENEAQNDV